MLGPGETVWICGDTAQKSVTVKSVTQSRRRSPERWTELVLGGEANSVSLNDDCLVDRLSNRRMQ